MLLRFVLPLVLIAACAGSSGDEDGDDATGALVITPASLPDGRVTAPYVTTLFVSGGNGEYEWSIVSGALPPGVVGIPASDSSATLNGTPSTAGNFSFTVMARDSVGATKTAAFQMTILSDSPGGDNGFSTSLLNAPSARGGHTAIWTGNEMIVWGGRDNVVGPLKTGGAYDPILDTWRTLSSVGAPAARVGHTAVWTGSEMIIWGGSDSAGPTGTGGAYDPITDTWRALPTTGAPLRRGLHTAIWTGTQMIVWGGEGVFAPPAPNSVDRVFGDGAAYDPVADAWSPIAAGGPTTRGHTAVWTGTRMIVWGGRDAFALSLQAVDVGGVYDPVSDSWTATSLAGAPAARVEHTVVWSGSEMIVWGGRSSTAFSGLSSGGRYSPLTNSWTATTTSGAPSARYGHTAVWTAGEMILWGGSIGASVLGTGAYYAPATNTWRPLPASFTPAARAEHTAVLAGAQMTIWGGRTDAVGTFTNTGSVLWLFQLILGG